MGEGRDGLVELKRDVRGGRARLTLARPLGVTGCAAGPPRDGQRDGRAAASYLVITRLRVGARFVARICTHPATPGLLMVDRAKGRRVVGLCAAAFFPSNETKPRSTARL